MRDSRPRLRALSPQVTTRPIVFDLARKGMRHALEAVVLAGSVLSVHNRVPWRDAYGRWVLYPWSGRLVHVPPDGYRAARADAPSAGARHVAILGLEYGAWAALALLREGIDCSFRLADDRVVSSSDLRLMPVGVHDLGTPRAEAVARAMYEIDPFVDIECFRESFEAGDADPLLVEGIAPDLVLVGWGTPAAALLAMGRARDLGIPVACVDRHVDVEALRRLLEARPVQSARKT